MGPSVPGAHPGEGQNVLPQTVTQVLPLVTRHSGMRVSLCVSLSFVVRPLLESSRSSSTLPEDLISSAELIKTFYFLKGQTKERLKN